MKILLLGEYSNVHNTLAGGLRQLGHEVTVASGGDFWKGYPRDTDLARRPGKMGGIRLLAKVWSLLPQWRGYDVVQLINPIFIDLKAERLLPIYRYLRRHNRLMVMGAMGMDWYWVHECCFNKPLRYSDFNIGNRMRTDSVAVKDRMDWLDTPKGRLNQLIAQDCDGIVSVLYEYQACYKPYFADKLQFIPLPINIEEATARHEQDARVQTASAPIRVFAGISKGRSQYKGTDIMLAAAEDVRRKYPDRMEIVKAEGVPFEQYQHLMDHSDLILDQLYSYTPAMNALLAMSKGIVVVGGGEPENYDILNETELRPIINVEPSYESVFHQLEQLVLHPGRLPLLKQQSKEYVRRHHDHLKVASLYEQFYKSLAATR